ncbi:hypothetical protein Btru_074463 [Bulinus truncatus]|nr:hypothetical protein Btru_074463 [Bulinus truncatus]
MADDTKLCKNCKRDISSANFVMHEVHCLRHIALCKDCNEPVPKADLQEHFKEVHAKIPCEKCNQEISKDAMAKHLAEECAKKLLRCSYCDLSVTKNELGSHMDYCGSRTECCALCRQYIMIKDMLWHESSGCTYPEPKPVPQPQNDPGLFNMEELQQLLNSPDYGAADYFTDAPSDLFSYNTNKSNYSLTSPVNNSFLTSSAIKKSDINLQRDKKLPNSVPPDVDYDEMLALQLAHEWEQDDIDIDSDLAAIQQNLPEEHDLVRRNSSGPSKNLTSHSNSSGTFQPLRSNKEDDEETRIPCEFCELEVSLKLYFDHVENCQVSKFIKQSQNASDLNNEISSPNMSLSRHSIPVINNLRSGSRYDHEAPKSSSSDGDIILPCEFCEEMFPSDIIIQHQSNCQVIEPPAQKEATSLVAGSRISHSVKARSVRTVPSPKLPDKSTKSRPRRQQSPSLINYVGQDGGDADENINYNKKPFSAMKPLESTSNKYSGFSVSRFDPAVTKPPRRLSRHNSHGDEDGPELVSKHEQKTREKLNQFLQEDVSRGATAYSTEDFSPSKPRRTTKQDKPGQGHRVKVDSRTVLRQMEDRPVFRQTEDSRTVLRQMEDRPVFRPTEDSRQNQSRKRTSQNSQISDENSRMPTVRNRQRSDHVFSPELRLKPENNLQSKKK